MREGWDLTALVEGAGGTRCPWNECRRWGEVCEVETRDSEHARLLLLGEPCALPAGDHTHSHTHTHTHTRTALVL